MRHAVAGGLCLTLAAAPVAWPPFVLAALVLLALALADAPGVRTAALRGWVWAFVGGLVVLRFLVPVAGGFTGGGPVVGVLALVVVAAGQALAWGFAGALVALLRRRAGLPPALAFALGTTVGCAVPAVFPWSPAALLTPWPALVQLADVVGELGVSAVVAALCGLAAAGLAGRDRPVVLAAVAGVATLALLGALRMATLPTAGPAVAVGVIDPGLSTAQLRGDAGPIVRRERALSARAEAAGAQLVVWPETTFPLPVARGAEAVGGDVSPVLGARVPRVVGAVTYRDDVTFNSVFAVTPDGRVGAPVDKRRLVPFGERVPLRGAVGFLRRGFARARESRAGAAPVALPVALAGQGTIRLGVLNCYEDLFRASGRDVARDVRPQLLLNVANAAWFAGTDAAALQAQLAALRAVELRTDVVRAVNRHGGGWVDAAGRSHDTPGAAAVTRPHVRAAGAPPTVWARTGDAPLWACCALVVLAGAARRCRGTGRPAPRARARA